jgi:hypothetical protein
MPGNVDPAVSAASVRLNSRRFIFIQVTPAGLPL